MCAGYSSRVHAQVAAAVCSNLIPLRRKREERERGRGREEPVQIIGSIVTVDAAAIAAAFDSHVSTTRIANLGKQN